MPEAAMHENDFSSAGENQIGPSGQIVAVQAVAKPEAKDQPPHEHFRLHARAANSTHIP